MAQNSPFEDQSVERRSPDILGAMVNSDRAIYGRNAVGAYSLQIPCSDFREMAAKEVSKSDRFPQPFYFRQSRKGWLFDLKVITDFQAAQQMAERRGERVFAITAIIREGLARKALSSPRGVAAYFGRTLHQRIRYHEKGNKDQCPSAVMSLAIEGRTDGDPSRLHVHMIMVAGDVDMQRGGSIWKALRSIAPRERSSIRVQEGYMGGPVTVGWARYMVKHNPRGTGRYYCSPAIAKESLEIYQRGCRGRRVIRKLHRAVIKNEELARS